ncbi:protoheme IX farnesyltransferase [Andreprevotia lacus DSM 23236]|jgi:protoheme IX farnesyltransferase|uniref:Protoheme IX farnesyltransferase n=1 Tax=Andreprevotia lacus DSM 23236 TaxID=1121001 RepID=A0A1W1Y098_9NEIS|nr:heme o synthase [Andreprevotia lacus]SMC29168.1 protoheme IX farnesyltransferase [Andreprevotia lacus DSM 23236]
MQTLALNSRSLADLWALGKPKVVSLIVFCAAVGAAMAQPQWHDLPQLTLALVGIGLIAMGAAAMNCLFERDKDANMRRTQARPLVRGVVGTREAAVYAGALTLGGTWLLLVFANPLATWLTLATCFGYAVVYTRWLKPATPQNIVIGGAAGAMPPILGWAAASGHVTAEATVLFLIIYTWTPPHFWALALYRKLDYAKAGLPMLPNTHGNEFTRLSILLYTFVLAAVTLIPFALSCSGWLYLAAALWLNGGFITRAWQLNRNYSDEAARALFFFSIRYLSWLFGALLVDRLATLFLF